MGNNMASPSTIVVTGASGGIGKVVVQELSKTFPKSKIFGTSRRGADPEEYFTGEHSDTDDVPLLKLDVGSQESVDHFKNAFFKKYDSLDALVNVAGILVPCVLANTTADDAKEEFETNYFGVIRMVNAFANSMIAKKSGIIVTVGSFGGRFPIPFQSNYSASKAAVAIYMDGLRIELARYGVRACLVEPGDTKPGQPPTRVGSGFNEDEVAKRAVEIMRKDEENGAEPSVVAKAVIQAIKSPSPNRRLVTGMDAKMVSVLQWWLPDAMAEWGFMKYYKVPTAPTK